MSNRIVNFNAGPAALPESVLEEARDHLLNYKNTGLSVMEMSHRSKSFEDIRNRAEQSLREVLNIPSGYHVLFLQGGATLQFSMLPMNFAKDGSVDIINSGSWTKKAIGEHKKVTDVSIVATGEQDNFLKLPTIDATDFSSSASYLYMCSNNTIFGTQFKQFPETGSVPLVVDMSSDILSRQLDVSKFGVIFAGAQKNIGPSGITIAIIREDLVDRCPDDLPSMLNYTSHINANSLYNTPPTFGIYMAGLVFDWILNQGGLSVVEEKNNIKARVLYDAIDNLDLFYSPIDNNDRSNMNVVFRIKDNNAELEKEFVSEAETAGFIGLKGHRSVGGLRASIYNAQTLENIQSFVDFMTEFSRRNG